jgi:hypothetical protein
MMEFVDANGQESVISWVLGGRGFMIHDPNKLVEILALLFGQTKYTSFRRQLSMWHFDRIVHGPSKGTFLHPYFVKGNRELCGLMSRQIKVRDPRRRIISSTTKPEELGSFKSEINECAHSRSKRSDSPNLSDGKSDNSVESCSKQADLASRHQQTVGATSSTTGNKVEKDKAFCKPYPSSFRWSFTVPQNEEYFDLEPSPIAPMLSTSSGVVASFEQPCFDEQRGLSSTKMICFPSIEKTSSLSLTNDGMNMAASLFENDLDLGSFAGKQFFDVDGNSDLPC